MIDGWGRAALPPQAWWHAEPITGDTPKHFFQKQNAWVPGKAQSVYRGCPERHWVLFLSIAGLYYCVSPVFAALALATLLADYAGDETLLAVRDKSRVWRSLAPLLPEEAAPAPSMLAVCWLAATFAVAKCCWAIFFAGVLAPRAGTHGASASAAGAGDQTADLDQGRAAKGRASGLKGKKAGAGAVQSAAPPPPPEEAPAPARSGAGTASEQLPGEPWLPVCLLAGIACLAWRGHVFRASVLGSAQN